MILYAGLLVWAVYQTVASIASVGKTQQITALAGLLQSLLYLAFIVGLFMHGGAYGIIWACYYTFNLIAIPIAINRKILVSGGAVAWVVLVQALLIISTLAVAG